MTWKVGAPVLVLLAGVLLSRTIPSDPPQERVRTAEVIKQATLAGVDGVQVFQTVQPPARESRRNLFAFTEVPRPVRSERPRVVPTEQPRVEQKTEPQTQPQREPEFPMRFIGTFGFAKDPIAVFENNGEIVNAKVGEVVTGEFRLASIGIESVRVSTARGTTQLVSLKP